MTKPEPAARENSPAPTTEEITKRMNEHFAKTGAYRADDLAKVLGDPKVGVTFVVEDAYTASMRKT